MFVEGMYTGSTCLWKVRIYFQKYEIVSNVGRYRLTIARIAMESQDNEQSSVMAFLSLAAKRGLRHLTSYTLMT